MEIKEAIKTIEVAMAEVEWNYPMDYATAFEMAIAALRAQQEAEKNEPLTLDELREMDGEPVCLAADNRWYIVNNNYLTSYGKRIPCGMDKWGQATVLPLLAECGVYRQLRPAGGGEERAADTGRAAGDCRIGGRCAYLG